MSQPKLSTFQFDQVKLRWTVHSSRKYYWEKPVIISASTCLSIRFDQRRSRYKVPWSSLGSTHCLRRLQKRERTGISFVCWLHWKSKHFKWNVTKWKATLSSLRVFGGKLSKWEPCKSCKIPYKPLTFCGLSTQSIKTLYFRWYLKSYHFAIFLP